MLDIKQHPSRKRCLLLPPRSAADFASGPSHRFGHPQGADAKRAYCCLLPRGSLCLALRSLSAGPEYTQVINAPGTQDTRHLTSKFLPRFERELVATSWGYEAMKVLRLVSTLAAVVKFGVWSSPSWGAHASISCKWCWRFRQLSTRLLLHRSPSSD